MLYMVLTETSLGSLKVKTRSMTSVGSDWKEGQASVNNISLAMVKLVDGGCSAAATELIVHKVQADASTESGGIRGFA